MGYLRPETDIPLLFPVLYYSNSKRIGPRDVPYPNMFGECSKKSPINVIDAEASLPVTNDKSNLKLTELLIVSMPIFHV
jgi:hypothetical protein